MVEFENKYVWLTAIDARMRLEVGEDLTAVLGSSSGDLRDRATDVIGPVREVVSPTIGGVTLATVTLPSSRRQVRERELLDWFACPTHRVAEYALVCVLIAHALLP